jgi:ribosome-associated protein
LLSLIAQIIFDKKGLNILALDVRGISTITDYIVIAEGNVDRHVRAITESLAKSLKEHGHRPLLVEGKSSEWVVMDYGDVIIHLFTPEVRKKYGLEQIWQEAKIVDLDIQVESTG